MFHILKDKYNQYCNSIDITTFDNMILHIDCNKAEDGLKTTSNSQCALNALAIDNPSPTEKLLFIKFEKNYKVKYYDR